MVSMPDFGKQVGPLPLGAWVAVVGGSFAFMLYQRNRASADATPVMNVDASAADLSGVGFGGIGAVGAYSPTGGGAVDTPASSTGDIQSNMQWGQSAFAFLAGQGNDAAFTDKAIRDYLEGMALDVRENALITQALSKFGMVPEGLPDAPPLPVTPHVPTPAPVTIPKPAPVAAPKVAPKPAPVPAKRTYTVKAGDSLSRIAARYWEPWITWRSLYNANKGVIGADPNRIHAGQVLVIA